MKTDFSRRGFLGTSVGIAALAIPGGAFLLGCEGPPRRVPVTGWGAGTSPLVAPGSPSPVAPSPSPLASPACGATETNIEGPYYRAGAPVRSDLRDPTTLGIPLLLCGRVLSLDCRSPLAGAVLDLWQADAAGHYDNDGSSSASGVDFRLRGKVLTDARGEFRVETIVPGRYLNGATYRPAHLHVKLAAEGHAPLTTQLYFPGDPYNAADPFLHPSLVMEVAPSPTGADARYDFVLVPSAG